MDKILIVEDDFSLSDLMKTVLESDGFETYTANSAEKAKELITSIDPTIALVDIILPGQGGMDLVLDLRTSCPNLGIIVTSGKIDMTKSTFQVLAHQFGVISILPKPFTVEELLQTVHETIDKKNLQV